MNYYESKRAARLERMQARIQSLRTEALKGSLKLYGEDSSGIPMGQPILVGHHSERRHRNHLKRIDNKMRKAVNAGIEADKLSDRIEAVANRRAIDSDNPEAETLLIAKIARLKDQRDALKASGQYESWQLTNLGAEIRRLTKRLDGIAKIQTGFESFTVNDCKVELVNGQIQIEFPAKPSEATRTVLKRSPLALKWSSYSGRWVRKHTETTASRYFKQELIRALEAVTYES